MKTRSGFVSNSSSSSFIVGFEKGQNTAEFMKNVVFNGQDEILYEYGDHNLSVDILVNHIMAELDGKQALDVNSMAEELTNGYCLDPRMPEYDFNTAPNLPKDASEIEKQEYRAKSREYWAYIDAEQKKAALIIAQEFIDKNPKLTYYQMEFGDDEQYGSQLEHGGTFSNMPHMIISKH